MRIILTMLMTAAPAYLLGGVNGAIITSRIFYRKDIRKFGSGNPGLTNFYRVFGKGGALLVVAIDVLKAVAPVLFGGWLFGREYDMVMFGRIVAGFFVMLGHSFPVFYKFKGGKGVMAAGAIMIVLDWRMALVAWGAFIIFTALTRYVSLGAIMGGVTFPISLLVFELGGTRELIAILACSLLMILRHWANIGRLIRGEESKFKFKKD